MPTRRMKPKKQLDPRPALAPKSVNSGPTITDKVAGKVKDTVVGGLKTYLSITQKAADAIEPYANKLPKLPQSSRGRGRRGR